jgi:transposase, IS5 family
LRKPPDLLAGDSGLSTPASEALGQEFGGKRVVSSQGGRISAERQEVERQGWVRRGFRFRAGIEGRITNLKRDDSLGVCPNHGEGGFGRWVGWGSSPPTW